MWAIVKLPKNLSTLTLLSITIASLIASELMLSIDSSAAYFLTPFRIFELSSGGLLAFLSQSQVSDKISSSLFTIGAVSIIASAFLLNSADPFPGLHAVIPVIGTALCIAYGYSSAGAILRIKPAVSIGLISYSVYLVHWPLLVLYKYYVFRELETPDKLALLIVSIALGWLQYKAIERVFISRKQLTLIIGTTLTALGSFAVFIASTSIVNNKGIPSRVPASYLAMASDPVKFHRSNYGGTGFKLETPLGDTSGKKIAVIGGDSFAHQYASGIDKLLKGKGLYIDGIFQHGCVLSGEYTRTLNNVPRQDCRDSYAKIISSLNGNNLPFVFAQSWDGYKNKIVDSAGTLVNSSSDEDYATVITNLLSGVRSDIGDRPFIIVGSQPYLSLSKSAASCLLRPSYVYQRCEESMHYRAEQAYSYKINMILKNFARNHKNTYYIDSFEALCPDGMCSTIESGKILYSDATHLSIDGSTKASTVITNKLTEVSDFH